MPTTNHAPELPPKNTSALPPSYRTHLSALLLQFLSQQLPPRPATATEPKASGQQTSAGWDADALLSLHKALWDGALYRLHDGKPAGLLGCDWETWTRGAKKRRRAERAATPFVPPILGGPSRRSSAATDDAARGRNLRVMTTLSTPTRGSTRAPSVASAPSPRASSPIKAEGDREQEADDALERWCDALRELPGFKPLDDGRSEWEMLENRSISRQSLHSTMDITDEPLPEHLLLAICVQFAPSGPGMASRSSASTLRYSRDASVEPKEITPTQSQIDHALPASLTGLFTQRPSHISHGHSQSHSSTFGQIGLPPTPAPHTSGSSGLGKSWWPSKWSESSQRVQVEADFVPGRFALPATATRRGSVRDEDDESEDDEARSDWSGTQRPNTAARAETHLLTGPAGVLGGGAEVGLVGGTIVVRGVTDPEEREAIVRALRTLIYALQSQLVELAFRDALRIPRELEPSTYTRRTIDLARPVPPVPHTESGPSHRRGFLSKLGLDQRGRSVFDGLMGRRRASRPREEPSQAGRTSGGIHGHGAEAGVDSPTLSSTSLVSAPLSRVESPSGYASAQVPTATPGGLHGIDRHLDTLKRLEGLLHSTSPGLVFPMPRVLLRVREEDRVRREKALEELRAERALALAGTGAAGASRIEGLPTSSSTPAQSGAATPLGVDVESDAELQDAIRGRAAGYRLGGDVRAGLGALASGLETFEGWMRLQRLDVLSWVAVEEVTDAGPGEVVDKAKGELPDAAVAEQDGEEPASESLGAEGDAGADEGVQGTDEKPLPRPPSPIKGKGTAARDKVELIACTKPCTSLHRFYDAGSDVSVSAFFADLCEELGAPAPGSGMEGGDDKGKASTSVEHPDGEKGQSVPGIAPDGDAKSSPASIPIPSGGVGERPSSPHVQSQSCSPDSLELVRSTSDIDGSMWEAVCPRKGCSALPREHVRVWVAGTRRVLGRVSVESGGAAVLGRKEGREMEVFVRDAEGRESRVGEVGLIAGEMSFYKFLEIIMHSTLLVPPLLLPTSSTPRESHPSPSEYTYHLRAPASGLSLALSVTDVPVLDARLPKLQVGANVARRRPGKEGARAAFEGVPRRGWAEVGRENVRLEVGQWVGGVRLRVAALRMGMMERVEAKSDPDSKEQVKTDAALDSLQEILLDADKTERDLLGLLGATSAAELNNVRIEFTAQLARVGARLAAWVKERKMDEVMRGMEERLPLPLPDYAEGQGQGGQGREMCLPGSSVLVREDEPGSVIAHTLSSLEYFAEICGGAKGSPSDAPDPSPDAASKLSKIGLGGTAAPGPTWTVEVRRRETPRDLLSLRTMTKKRSEASLPLRAPLPLSLASLAPNQPSAALNLEPVIATAATGAGAIGSAAGTDKDQDKENRNRMDELVKTISKATALDPVLHGAAGSTLSRVSSRSRAGSVDGSGSGSASVRVSESDPEGERASVKSSEGVDGPGHDQVCALPTPPAPALPKTPGAGPRVRRRLTDEAPPSAFRRSVSASIASPRIDVSGLLGTPPRSGSGSGAGTPGKESSSLVSTPLGLGLGLDKDKNTDQARDKENKDTWGSVTSTFSSSVAHLLRLGTDVTDSLASRVGGTGTSASNTARSRSLAAFMAPLGLSGFDSVSSTGAGASASASASGSASVSAYGAASGLAGAGTLGASSLAALALGDDKPHVQFIYALPGRTRLSCTVYYAAAFDTLRRRCAVDRSFVRSLERTIGWAAEGGKSRANFWKSEDGRLVVKELVSKWNVSDMQALLEVAPAYFEHMANTHNRATSLAKIVGFFSVKVHDLQTGQKRTMDLLVMENLWWQQSVGRQFDLKGIEGRRVPKGREDQSILFDAEWLDMQARDPILIHPHAKRILLDSLAFDTRFLSAQSIMDYSLLLGLDRAAPELVVGLVDAVGSYGLFKNIESRGKMALNRGREGEVTVIPPDQYRERFEGALRSYFTVSPDKWSRASRRPTQAQGQAAGTGAAGIGVGHGLGLGFGAMGGAGGGFGAGAWTGGVPSVF